MTVEEALELARRHGVNVMLDGDSLHLEADAPPPNGLLAILGRGKWDIVAALRLREAEERRRIVQWINDHFTSSPPGVCAHCGDGPRSEDPFVLLFVGNDRGEVHASCHSAWLAEREAEARKALGLEPSTGGDRAGVKLNDRSTMMRRRRTGETNDMAASPLDLRRMRDRPALAAGGNHIIGFTGPFVGGAPTPARDVDSYGIKIRTDGGLGRLNPRKARRDLRRQNVEAFNDKLIVPQARVPRKGTPNKEGQT